MRGKAAALGVVILLVALGLGPLDPASAEPPPVSVCDTPTSTSAGGNDDDLTVTAGQVLLLTAGTYTGKLDLGADGTLCVDTDATLQPRTMKSPAGDLFVLGAADLPSLTSVSEFDLVVQGTATLGNLTLDGSSELTIGPTGSATTGTIDLNSGSQVDNAGRLEARLDTTAGSTLLNSGELVTRHGLAVDGVLRNTGHIRVFGGPFRVNAGATMSNECVIDSSDDVTVNSGSGSGVTNAGIIRAPSGVLRVGQEGVFTQTPDGITVSETLDNSGTVTGFGRFRFAGTTLSELVFAGDTPAQPIVVQDLTPPAAPKVFDQQSGSVVNTVAGTVENPPPDATVGTCATHEPVADVLLTKTGPANVSPGGTVNYAVTVHNAGPDTATGIVVTDTLPAELTNVFATGGGVVAGGTVTWTVASLANQADVQLTVTGFAPMSGTLTNTVSSTSTTSDPNPSNNNGSTPGQAVTTRVNGTLPAGNLPPVLDDVVVSTRATQTVAGAIPVSDPDEGQEVVTELATQAAHGVATAGPDGVFEYTPDGTFTGIDGFAIQGCDNALPQGCATGTVTVVVAPLAVRDAAETIQNVPVSIPVLTNDVGDSVGGPRIVDAPAHGTAVMVGAEVEYTPGPDYVGPDLLTYRICSNPVTVCGEAVVAINVLEPPNEPPTAQDVAVTGPADAPLSGIVPASDPDVGQVLTATLLVPPSAGTAVVNPDRSFTFTPPADTADVFTFVVRVCDNDPDQLCDPATVTATITPVAHPDNATTVVDTPVAFSLTANDRGGVGAPALVAPGPADGDVTVAADGQASYTPDPGFTGQDAFQYTVCATAEPSLCVTGTATVFVDPAPLPPVEVEPATLTTTATVPVVAYLTFNHAAPDLVFTVSGAATDGTGVVDATGRVTYTPTGLFTGRDEFTVRACAVSEPANCGTALVTVTVLPVAGDDSAAVEAGGSVDIPVATNDIGTVGPPQDLSDPAGGTAVVSAGLVRYTPDAGFVGTDTFTYTICSTVDVDVCATATVSVLVSEPPNQPPTAQDANVTGPADAAVSGRVEASDPDVGQALSFTLLTPPTTGAAVVNPDGTFTFTPPTNTADVFTFVAQVCDDHPDQLCDQADVTATITPVAHPDFATTTAGVPVTLSLTGNDLGGVGAPVVVTSPVDGTVTIEPGDQATYTPDAGFTGDDTFGYRVCATAEPALCTTGSATVHVGAQPLPPVQGQPAALTTTATVPVVADLTFNHAATDLAFTVSSAATDGTGVVDATGRVTYTPAGLFTGRDEFTVRACAVTEPANCGTAVVTVTVVPVAGDDSAVVEAGSSADIPVEANDVGTVGTPQDVSDPANGTALPVTTSVRYTPDDGFVGVDSFTYTICSTVDTDVCATATVDVTVTLPPNLAPTAQDASVTGPAGAPVSGQVLVSDPDVGQVLTVTLLTPPAAGNAVVSTSGSFTFTPPANTADVFTFGVQVCDDATDRLCDQATVTATIAPVAQPDAAATTAGIPVTFPLTVNDLGGVGSPVVVVSPVDGTAVVEPDGRATYTPDAGFTGDDTFQYQVCATAEANLCTIGTVTVHVDPQPLPPVVVQGKDLTTTATVPVVADLTFNHAAADLVFTVSGAAVDGTGTVDGTGRVTYTPTGPFTGRDEFTVRACAIAEPTNCGTALVTVTVLPVAEDDVAVVEANGSVDIPVETNDVGAVGGLQDLTQPANGSTEVGASVVYTPDNGFVGTDTFRYTICSTVDADVCATATVRVSVQPLATSDALATEAGAPDTVDLLANDITGPDPVATIVSGPADGTVDLRGGLLTYTPIATFTGHDQLVYRVCAPSGPPLCAEAQVLVEVSPDVNPVLTATLQDTAISIDVAGNDFGDAGTPVVTRPPAHGTVTGGGLELVRAIVGTGNVDLRVVAPLVYTPDPGFVGADTFLYTRCAESTSLCSETAVVVVVQPLVTEPPVTPPPTTPPPTTPPATPTTGSGSGALSATGAGDVYPLMVASLLALSLGALLVTTSARRRHRRRH
ncbi:Ig-like domain-containing protein [Cellulomonas sp. URHD0024]|uniref:Ig-like domain-containing protein n=1 Tax=Cellulomonas sp. URHD0024 TaxID=1302620 RepID=UPI0004123E43|nr:Ig-like domain-containing protein [Cellulomonas sp. URHD0024]